MPRDGSATRERILQVAERLMVEHGYKATTLDQVIAEAASSKGAFFHHFSSKSDLASQLIDRYAASDLAHLDAGLAAVADIDDPAARLIAFVRYFEDGADELLSEQTGCLYATVLAERQLIGPEFTEPCGPRHAAVAAGVRRAARPRAARSAARARRRSRPRRHRRPPLHDVRGRLHPVPHL